MPMKQRNSVLQLNITQNQTSDKRSDPYAAVTMCWLNSFCRTPASLSSLKAKLMLMGTTAVPT